MDEAIWLPAGSHDLAWIYQPPFDEPRGRLPALLDQVTFEPGELWMHDLLGLSVDRPLAIWGGAPTKQS